jgi:hypothetical protein
MEENKIILKCLVTLERSYCYLKALEVACLRVLSAALQGSGQSLPPYIDMRYEHAGPGPRHFRTSSGNSNKLRARKGWLWPVSYNDTKDAPTSWPDDVRAIIKGQFKSASPMMLELTTSDPASPIMSRR